MELCSADVRIGGNSHHTVPKENLTPAEILVLKRIHGDDAVQNIRSCSFERRDHKTEFERLKKVYGKAGRLSSEGEPSVVLDQMFPGAIKMLPVTLAEIGLGDLSRPDIAEAIGSKEDDNGEQDKAGSESSGPETGEAGQGEAALAGAEDQGGEARGLAQGGWGGQANQG